MSLEEDILIERYLKNELSKEEKQSFIERMDNDALFKEKVILEKQLSETLHEDSWSFLEETDHPEIKEYEALLKSKETQALKEGIHEAHKAYEKSQRFSKNWIFYVAAAVVIVFFSTTIFDFAPKSNQELFDKYMQKTDLIALVDRSGYDSIFSKAQKAFDSKNYQEVTSSLSTIVDSTKNSSVFVHLAIAEIEQGKFDSAEKVLNKLINSNLLDNQKGYWYKSLLYLKSDQVEKSKKELNTIIKNSYYKYKEAKQLLKKIQ